MVAVIVHWRSGVWVCVWCILGEYTTRLYWNFRKKRQTVDGSSELLIRSVSWGLGQLLPLSPAGWKAIRTVGFATTSSSDLWLLTSSCRLSRVTTRQKVIKVLASEQALLGREWAGGGRTFLFQTDSAHNWNICTNIIREWLCHSLFHSQNCHFLLRPHTHLPVYHVMKFKVNLIYSFERKSELLWE